MGLDWIGVPEPAITGRVTFPPGFLGDAFRVEQHCLSFSSTTFLCDELSEIRNHLMVEGAVAAFLFDATEDSGLVEPFDDVAIGQDDLGNIIKTCEVTLSGDRRPDRIHWLIHCIERGISGYDLGFPGSEKPTGFSVSSSHSVNATDLTMLWRKHFFDSDQIIPPPTVSLIGPECVEEETVETWSASVNAGTPPFTYQWERDGFVVSTTGSYTDLTQNDDFHLQVQVMDNEGRIDFDDVFVTVLPPSGENELATTTCGGGPSLTRKVGGEP